MVVSERDTIGAMHSPSHLTTSAAILESAAHLLADRDASMSEIAAAAGVGRATLYRHYPTREALLTALAEQALEEVATRIADAGLDRVSVPEALERLARAVVAVGDRYTILVRERVKPHDPEAKRRLADPMRALFERGVADGTLRTDLSPDAQLQLFASAVTGALRAGLQRELGLEQAAATVTSYFLQGARRASPS
jgi:TetR/AcrR family transcriptional regulator, mexCD-oprJ operon repressor